VRLVIELSQYYTTHYETIMQYVVVSPSVSSRQDVWTYGIFKYLIQAEVLLLDALSTMLPHDLQAQDASDHQAINAEKPSPPRSQCSYPNTIEDIKHYLRVRHQLDLWSHYYADHNVRTPARTPSTLGAPAEAVTVPLRYNADAALAKPPDAQDAFAKTQDPRNQPTLQVSVREIRSHATLRASVPLFVPVCDQGAPTSLLADKLSELTQEPLEPLTVSFRHLGSIKRSTAESHVQRATRHSPAADYVFSEAVLQNHAERRLPWTHGPSLATSLAV